MKKAFLLLLGVIFLSLQLWAQKTITGKVTNERGDPVANASVVVKGTKVGTVTIQDGTYLIIVPASGTVLVISSVDMMPQEITIGTQTEINVSLKETDQVLGEAVVVGYTTQRKKDVAAAISKIGGDAIKNLPIPTVAQAMQGRAAGVSVVANNGIPGGSITVLIRGNGSINYTSEPLYVVDGIQINTNNTAVVAASTLSTIKTQNNPLGFLNAADIESIEVLKDAAAAAIYGAKAAGGVVLITTKKGTAGKARYTVNAYYGQVSPMRTQTPMNNVDWLQARIEAIINTSGGVITYDAARATAIGTDLQRSAALTDAEFAALPSTDWVKETWRNGVVKSLEMSMMAGNATTSVYMSGSYNKQEAVIKPTDFERGTFLLKSSHKPSNKLLFESQINLSTIGQRAHFGQVGGGTATINAAYTSTLILPINPVRRPDGTWYNLAGSGDLWVGSYANNIAAAQELFKSFTRTNQMVGSVSGTYNFNNDLSLKSMAGLDYRIAQSKAYYDPRLIGAQYATVSGTGEIASNWNTNFITNTVLNYRRSLKGGHNVSGLLGVEYRRDVANASSAQANTFPTFDFQNLNSAATPVAIGESWTAYATWSQFARLGYNYNSRYIVGFILRRDGSSRFGSNNLYGFFPSVQVAWNAKDEKFMQNLDVISELKLRYSYGESGNDQIGNFDSRQLYGSIRVYNNGSAINPTQLGNPDLTWETRQEHNAGFDLGLLRNRIGLTVDVFRRLNTDLLLNRSLYATTGFTSISQNTGSVLNRGIEILLRGTPFNGVFKWSSTFNISFIKNKVVSLYGGLDVLPGSPQIKVGESPDSYFNYRWAGVDPATGRPMWYDINGNITHNPTANDRVFIGKNNPDYFGGWLNNFSYKGFEVDAFFQYEYGRLVYESQLQWESRIGYAGVTATHLFFDQRWTTPGQVTSVPRPTSSGIDQNSADKVATLQGSRFFYHTDYIRLKQLTVAYNIPQKLLNKVKMNSVRVYAQGINIWTYTKHKGLDPEYTGSNNTAIPVAKNMTVGVTLGF